MKKLLTMLMLLTFLVPVFGQKGNFIELLSDGSTEKKTEHFGKFKNMSSVKSLQLVKMGNLKNFITGKKIDFTIHGYEKKLRVDITLLEAEEENSYTCYGRFENNAGDLIILCKENKITGWFSIDDKLFQIYYNDDETHTLIERDNNELKKNEPSCGMQSGSSKSTSSARIMQPAAVLPCGPVAGIRVLSLVTAAARQLDPNFVQTISIALAQFNTAAINSNLANASSKLINGGVLPFSFIENPFPNGSTVSVQNTEIDRIINDASATILRNENAADIVVLVTNAPYGFDNFNPNGTVAGFVRDDAFSTSITKAYANVRINFANTQFSFAHEIGHLLGGRHQTDTRATSNDLRDYAFGDTYSYKTCGLCSRKYERTIMAVQEAGITFDRRLRFSNPNVSVSGSVTGTPLRNVARRIDEYSPTIAGFYPERLTASISGPTNIQPIVQNTWEANVSCGNGYTYQWAESTDGIFYSNVSGATNITFSQVTFPGATFARYKRVRVTSSNGQVTNAFIFVTVNGVSAFVSPQDENTSTDEVPNINWELKNDEIQVFPNPAINASNVEVKILNDGKVRLDLVDNNGKLIENYIDAELKQGVYKQLVNTAKLREGVYYLKLTSQNETKTIRLIHEK